MVGEAVGVAEGAAVGRAVGLAVGVEMGLFVAAFATPKRARANSTKMRSMVFYRSFEREKKRNLEFQFQFQNWKISTKFQFPNFQIPAYKELASYPSISMDSQCPKIIAFFIGNQKIFLFLWTTLYHTYVTTANQC